MYVSWLSRSQRAMETESMHNNALIRAKTTLRFICAAQLKCYGY